MKRQKNSIFVKNPSIANINSMMNFYKLGNYIEAIKLAELSIHKFPKHQFSWKVLGASYKQVKQFDKSLIANEMAVNLFPSDAEANNNLGVTLQDLGRHRDAEKIFLKAINLKENFAEANYNLAITLQELGRNTEAINRYTIALEIKSDYAEVYSNLGQALQEIGSLEEAEKNYRKAISFRLNDSKTYAHLASCLIDKGDFENAKFILQSGLDVEPKEWSLHFYTSVYFYKINKLIFSQEKMELAKSIAPTNKIDMIELALMAISSDIAILNRNDIFLKEQVISKTLIYSRKVDDNLIEYLNKLNTRQLDGTIDARFGNGRCSTDLSFLNDPCLLIKTVSEDLKKICSLAFASEVFICDSFFNIFSSGAGTIEHNHIGPQDKYFNLSMRKYSLIYYVDIGDQNCDQPGFLNICNPNEIVVPLNGMIVIFEATRNHSAIYNGKKDRVLIALNFYCYIDSMH